MTSLMPIQCSTDSPLAQPNGIYLFYALFDISYPKYTIRKGQFGRRLSFITFCNLEQGMLIGQCKVNKAWGHIVHDT